MAVRIDGGVIVVTGASSGIGWAMAMELASRAKALIVIARREQRLLQLREELIVKNPKLIVSVRCCDLSDMTALSSTVDAIVQDFPVIDALINNAGLADINLFHRSKWEKLNLVLQVNIVALTYLTRRLLPQMIERKSGGILNVSSGFGFGWLPFFAGYVGSKHYVTAFTDCLQLELSGTGVTVSQVCPGPVRTEFEEVSGNPFMKTPKWIEITPAYCARKSIAGFAKGKPTIIPGMRSKVLLWLGALTPRWMQRFALYPLVPWVRNKL